MKNILPNPEMLDDVNPEWTEAMFRTAKFGQCAAIRNQLRRAAATSHGKYISIRLSPEVVQFLKRTAASGKLESIRSCLNILKSNKIDMTVVIGGFRSACTAQAMSICRVFYSR